MVTLVSTLLSSGTGRYRCPARRTVCAAQCSHRHLSEEDGIVSGNDFYPTVPQTLTAVFEPDVPAAINSSGDAAATYNSAAADLYDLAGRKITTPHGGQIIIRNRKKVIF